MMVSLPILISMLAISVTPAPRPPIDCFLEQPDSTKDELASTQFITMVNRYVDLHHRLDNPMSPRTLSSDPEQVQHADERLAAAIHRARHASEPERVFSPNVANFFRHRIAMAMRDVECDVAALLDEMEEATLPDGPAVVLNGPFPWGLGESKWFSVIWRLPDLPPELAYRFAGRHLVLLDLHANLVVDVLENALPWEAAAEGAAGVTPWPEPEATPCDAHPELPMCWS